MLFTDAKKSYCSHCESQCKMRQFLYFWRRRHFLAGMCVLIACKLGSYIFLKWSAWRDIAGYKPESLNHSGNSDFYVTEFSAFWKFLQKNKQRAQPCGQILKMSKKKKKMDLPYPLQYNPGVPFFKMDFWPQIIAWKTHKKLFLSWKLKGWGSIQEWVYIWMDTVSFQKII